VIDRQQLTDTTGIKNVRRVSETTVVLEFANGSVRPATRLELIMWAILTQPSPG
jgi:hypothetical protein